MAGQQGETMNLLLDQIKPYLYAVLLIALVSFGVYVHWLSESRDKYKASSELHEAEAKSANAIIYTERKAAADANERAKQTQIEKKVIEDEAQANKNCIANKSCGVRFVFKSAVCNTVPTPAASGSNIDGGSSQDVGDFAQWYIALEAAIKENLLQIKKLQEDLKVRSDPAYCQPK